MKLKNALLILVAIFTFGLIVGNFVNKNSQFDTPLDATDAEEVSLPNIAYGIDVDSLQVITSNIGRNEFLATIFESLNIQTASVNQILNKVQDEFDVRKIRAGNPYSIFQNADSVVQYFVYEKNKVDYLVVDLTDSVSVYSQSKNVTVKRKTAAGTIDGSLYWTLQELGLNTELAVRMADIYAWDIDFYRLNRGDEFRIIYDESFIDDQSIGVKRIHAAQFKHFNKNFQAYYFEQDSVDYGTYFNEEGQSLRKALLKAPLKFSRISSRYTKRRFHPVQKRYKAHLGTDYAAPRGTPIYSVGDGIIVARAYKKYNGNYVKVKHNSVYTTQYLHMSSFKKGQKVGDHVRQGEVIGYVGSTGLATGNHVCFRFWKNGEQVDPFRQELPPSEPIKEEKMDEFMASAKIWQREFKLIEEKQVETIVQKELKDESIHP